MQACTLRRIINGPYNCLTGFLPTKLLKFTMTSGIRNVFDYLQRPLELESVLNDQPPKPGSISGDEVSIAGKDGWLYLYKGTNNYYDAYAEKNDVACALATKWGKAIDGYCELFKNTSTNFVATVIPNKASVIPEHYPLDLNKLLTPRLSILRDYLNDRLYCPLEELQASSWKSSIFRRVDTHFTEFGNLFFATGILKKFGIDISAFELAVELLYRDHRGDLGGRYPTPLYEKVPRFRFAEKFDVSIQEISPPVSASTGLIYESNCSNAPIQARLIVFGNSFFDRPNSWSMAPFFCRIFRTVRFHWESGVYEKYVNEFSPDYAIFQSCERFLLSAPRELPFSAKYYNSLKDKLHPDTNKGRKMKSDEAFYFNVIANADQVGEAFIYTHSIGKVGPGMPFPIHQLVNHEENLIKHGVTLVSSDGVSVSKFDLDNYKSHYLSASRVIDQLQSSIAPGKWVLYAFRPKKDGFIDVDFGIILPIELKDKLFSISCDGRPPISTAYYYDKHLGTSHWFMPIECVIGLRCRFKIDHLTPYLHFDFSFVDSTLAASSQPYRTLVTFTDTKMLEGMPDLARIQRVASKNANKNSFLNGGRTSYLALKSIAEKDGIDFSSASIRVLDWGVGCGRVARHFLEHPSVNFTGIDIDEDNLGWCRENLRGTYLHVDPEPPTAIAADSFDFIYSCSVLSHLTERDADTWLNEIARILSGDGVALLSYNGLSNSASYLSRRPIEFMKVLNRQLFDADINHELDGFIPGKDYYRASFASDEWWLAMFEKYFNVIRIEYSVVNGYQHVAVLKKKGA